MSTGGYVMGSPEYFKVMDRLSVLDDSKDGDGDFNHLVGVYANRNMQVLFEYGLAGYAPLTNEMRSKVYSSMLANIAIAKKAELKARDAAERIFVGNCVSYYIFLAPIHTLPEFDKEVFAGADGSRLRTIIKDYDFDSMHAFTKSSTVGLDPFLFGANSHGMLLFYGDIKSAKAGWLKLTDAWKKIAANVSKGERSWSEYLFEGASNAYTAAGDMWFAGEMGMLREYIQHLPGCLSLHDPLVANEWEACLRNAPMAWQTPEGYYCFRVESFTLMNRALTAVADDGKPEADAMRAWLPRPDKLLVIAEHEAIWQINSPLHPALLCATLYTRLGDWEDAKTVADGILAMAPLGSGVNFGMPVIHRVEAWRLLARCRGAFGDAAGACEALERAVSEAQAVGYVFLQVASLRDMLPWTEATSLPGSVGGWEIQERIAAIVNHLECGEALKAGWGGC